MRPSSRPGARDPGHPVFPSGWQRLWPACSAITSRWLSKLRGDVGNGLGPQRGVIGVRNTAGRYAATQVGASVVGGSSAALVCWVVVPGIAGDARVMAACARWCGRVGPVCAPPRGSPPRRRVSYGYRLVREGLQGCERGVQVAVDVEECVESSQLQDSPDRAVWGDHAEMSAGGCCLAVGLDERA